MRGLLKQLTNIICSDSFVIALALCFLRTHHFSATAFSTQVIINYLHTLNESSLGASVGTPVNIITLFTIGYNYLSAKGVLYIWHKKSVNILISRSVYTSTHERW